MSSENLRPAVRGLLIDPEDRIALVQLDFPTTKWTGWILPGGGIEPGEDTVAALRRELAEEVGATEANSFIGPILWRRRHHNPGIASGFDGQQETVYLVPCHGFELAPEMTEAELLSENVVAVRWWSLAELQATDEVVRPDGLADLVVQTLEHGAPAEPPMFETWE